MIRLRPHILGLRSLHFLLASVMDRFRYLQASLVFTLTFVEVKTLLSHHDPIPILSSLAMIGAILAVGILASAIPSRRESRRGTRPAR